MTVVLGGLCLAAALTGCFGPEATEGLEYEDLDAAAMDEVVLVVAASRQSRGSADMMGSTLLVGTSGEVRRIDNEGADVVRLSYDGSTVAFPDAGHDYFLGTDQPVRSREKIDDPLLFGSHLYKRRLVSLFNVGVGEDSYDSALAVSGVGVQGMSGYADATAVCDDGVWALNPPDELEPADRVELRRVWPQTAPSWTIDVQEKGSSLDLALHNATCSGHDLVALGDVVRDPDSDDSTARQVVVTVDVRTGRTRRAYLDRPERRVPSPAGSYFRRTAVVDDDAVTVEVPREGTFGSAEVTRIDRSTGAVERLFTLKGTDESSKLLFRFQDDLLYVLDVTRDARSVLTAYAFDGSVRGSRTMPALDDRINGRFAGSESRQAVRDFVVLQGPDTW